MCKSQLLMQTDPRDAVHHAHLAVTKLDGQCDKLATAVHPLLTTLDGPSQNFLHV